MLSALSRQSGCHQPLSPQALCLLHTSRPAPASALATLRKNTGYSLSICKKALAETDNNVAAAEQWLRDQAQAQGWAKAQKLQGRNTSQGLLGVLVKAQTAALVEVNCETDFVARNQQFVSLLKQVADSCLVVGAGTTDQELTTSIMTRDEVSAADSVEAGKKVGDLVALNIGKVGENMALGPARILQSGAGVRLAAQCHPSVTTDGAHPGWHCGRYAAVLAYKVAAGGSYPDDVSEEVFIKQLCQHIVGMGPTSVNNEDDKENSLLHQTFLMDEEKKVSEVLDTAGVTVIDFVRAEVGRSD